MTNEQFVKDLKEKIGVASEKCHEAVEFVTLEIEKALWTEIDCDNIFRDPLTATCDYGTFRPASELEKREKKRK